jgi:hypothetical protein
VGNKQPGRSILQLSGALEGSYSKVHVLASEAHCPTQAQVQSEAKRHLCLCFSFLHLLILISPC